MKYYMRCVLLSSAYSLNAAEMNKILQTEKTQEQLNQEMWQAFDFDKNDIRLEKILPYILDVEVRDQYKRTPLMLAAQKGYKEIASLLIEKGADVDAESSGKWTALIYAVAAGHKDIVKLLIYHHANLNKQNNNGYTALMDAADRSDAEMVRLLVAAGADVNIRSSAGLGKGKTALDYAKPKHKTAIEAAIKAGEKDRADYAQWQKEAPGKIEQYIPVTDLAKMIMDYTPDFPE